ncbi:hypothetical protein [Vibrio owensii]|uniref:hypothetical protein n=1 Tax=Vibrio harveyi group TaxID=717610 RepID=UPI003CC649B9
MSTPLKTIKETLTFVKTCVSRALDESHDNGIYADFLTESGILKAGAEQTATELEKELFLKITDQNIDDFNASYRNERTEEAKAQRTQVENVLSNIDKLNTLIMPRNHMSDGMLAAMVYDINHGLDKETPLEKALYKLQGRLKVEAVKAAPGYVDADIDTIERAALAVTSMRSWGDMLLEMDSGTRMVMEQLQTWGEYSQSGNRREFYSENVLAGHMNSLYKDDFAGLLYTGKSAEYALPDVVSLTGMQFNIASDIPKATENDMFAVAKLFNGLKDHMATAEWADKARQANPELSDRGIQDMRNDVTKMGERYCSMVASNLPGYRRYFNQIMDKSSEPTL